MSTQSKKDHSVLWYLGLFVVAPIAWTIYQAQQPVEPMTPAQYERHLDELAHPRMCPDGFGTFEPC